MRRALNQIARTAIRAPTPVFAPTRVHLARPIASKCANRQLSISAVRKGPGVGDEALAAKLQSELEYEQNSSEDSGEPDFLKAFTSNGVWIIEDKEGADEVALKRKYGNEEIKVLFSIADIDNTPEAQENEAQEEEEEAAEEESSESPSLPIRTAITISKGAGEGAMTIDAVAQDGVFLVDNISLYNDEKLATELTSEADWKRRGLYMGPAFDNLDEALQTEFETFLEERGIDSGLALFIPDLAEFKEQKEYVRWLANMKKFVEA